MVHSRAVRVRLDDGSDGLAVALPQSPLTVIEPVFRDADPDPHGALLAGLRAPIDSASLRSLVTPRQKVAISAPVEATAMWAPQPVGAVLTPNSGYLLDHNLYHAAKGLSATAQIFEHGPDQWPVQAPIRRKARGLVKMTALQADEVRAAKGPQTIPYRDAA